MNIHPIKVPPLQNVHKFKKVNKLIKDCYHELKKLNLLIQDSPSSALTILEYKDAYDALQKTKIVYSLEKLILLKNDSPKEGTKFYNYLNALQFMKKQDRRFCLNRKTLLFVHKLIQSKLGKNQDRGRLRNRQNWIGPEGRGVKEAYFFPPIVSELNQNMFDLDKYLNKSQDDPLIKLALFFAQFLMIHPFMDGNGRVARSVIGPFLCYNHILSSSQFFTNAYFKKKRLEYFETLYEITDSKDWLPWIQFFLNGLKTSAKMQQKAVLQLNNLYKTLNEKHVPQKLIRQLFQDVFVDEEILEKKLFSRQLLNEIVIKKIDKKPKAVLKKLLFILKS